MKTNLTAKEVVKAAKSGDRAVLARAITMLESRKPEHKTLSEEIIKAILPLTGKARRIGISGTPGVGKSTFLENYGMHLISQGKKIAILAIDPSSQKSGGSILGDKTRMEKLSAHDHAFIRPSPNGKHLGGIAAKTREAMLLCEAFGFDYIFIETVGVGQSEISVSHLVDMFILLMQPASGDELQGIKRGILEVSDLVLVNKADGELIKAAKVATHDYERSLSILQNERTYKTKVLSCSSLNHAGFDNIDQALEAFFDQFDLTTRQAQMRFWLEELLYEKFASALTEINFDQEVSKIQEGSVGVLGLVDDLYKRIMDK